MSLRAKFWFLLFLVIVMGIPGCFLILTDHLSTFPLPEPPPRFLS